MDNRNNAMKENFFFSAPMLVASIVTPGELRVARVSRDRKPTGSSR
jgi:hypothetical protein